MLKRNCIAGSKNRLYLLFNRLGNLVINHPMNHRNTEENMNTACDAWRDMKKKQIETRKSKSPITVVKKKQKFSLTYFY